VIDDSWLNLAFGTRLRQRRIRAGISQDELAVAAGLSRTSIVNIEQGRQGASLSTLYRLADALACRSADLLPPLPETDLPRIAIGDESAESKEAVMRVVRRARGREARLAIGDESAESKEAVMRAVRRARGREV
jgi:transcriptional regulator with XRE-family HTH domain